MEFTGNKLLKVLSSQKRGTFAGYNFEFLNFLGFNMFQYYKLCKKKKFDLAIIQYDTMFRAY
jgi:hypothetical protein